MMQSKSDIIEWLTTFTADSIVIAKFHTENTEKNLGCNVNPYYSIELGKKIISLLLYFPLYSSVMVSIFKYGSPTATSAAVEAEFNDCKHRLLKNISRPMRVDKFVTLHLQSFSGRMKLAIADQISEPKNIFDTKNTERMTRKHERLDIDIENDTVKLEKKILDLNITLHTSHSHQNSTCSEVDLTQITCNENVQSLHTTDVMHIGLESPIQINTKVDDKEMYVCNTTASSENTKNEYSDWNDEHNWQNKNERKTIRRTYLEARPDFTGVCKRKKIDMAILQNGNICESIKHGKVRFVVINTCGFDSVVQLFSAACIHETFHDKGVCKLIYRQRATLLRKIDYLVSENTSNVVTINALSNVCNLCEFFFKGDPSCTLIKTCDNCKKTTTRNLILFNLDFQTIQSHGYNTIAQAIQNYTTSNHKKCEECGENVKLTVNYHSHLLIECVGDGNVSSISSIKNFSKSDYA